MLLGAYQGMKNVFCYISNGGRVNFHDMGKLALGCLGLSVDYR